MITDGERFDQAYFTLRFTLLNVGPIGLVILEQLQEFYRCNYNRIAALEIDDILKSLE